MMLKRAVALAMLVACGSATARPVSAPGQNPQQTPGRNGDAAGIPDPGVGDFSLKPRRELPKPKTIQRPSGESNLFVKFRDDVKARATPAQGITAQAVRDTEMLPIIAAQYGLRFTPCSRRSDAELQALEQKAAIFSRKAQPDLAGMMYVDGDPNTLGAAAQALLNLDSVEFVQFIRPRRPAGATGTCCIGVDGVVNCVDDIDADTCEAAGGLYEGDGSTCAGLPGGVCPTIGGCCVNATDCVALTEAQCTGLGGAYKGDGSNCVQDGIDCTNEGCGDPANLGCFVTHANPFCDDVDCCNQVCAIRPFCCDDQGGQWDDVCVAIANLFCQGGDVCASELAGNCFEAHPNAGCNDPGCCGIVCGIDDFCCQNFWDQNCVDLALDNCINPNGGGPTPDFNALQGYLRATAYADQPGGTPAGLSPPADIFTGYTGEGYDLFDNSLLADDPDVTPTSVRFAGLYGLGRELKEVYHVGDQSGARGHGIKVAVIEWACYKNHEDLNVHVEPHQTLILIPDITHPDHATACLGIINGLENGFGVTGVAPDAEAWFFPLTSVEEGPRITDAFLSAYATLDPGDVVSCSFGGGTNLNNEGDTNALMQFGSDLGITTLVAAGNNCFNLDNSPGGDIGDSGAIVVGACEPGFPWCRLSFSNHYESGTGSQVVHVSSWGECVTSLAGNALLWFPGGNWNRAYTSGFNGTSAATPQAAGVVACLQGLAKQFYGLPLSPGQVRAVLVGGAFPQCGVQNPNTLPGFDDALGCGPDADPEEAPNKIGPYVQPRESGAFMLNQFNVGFGDAPLIDDITILRGDLVYGTKYSIKGSDDNYLVIKTQYTNRKFHPSVPGPGSQVNYYATAQTADLLVSAHSDVHEPNSLSVSVEVASPPTTALLFTEVYDWDLKKWVNIGFDTLGGGGGDVVLQHQAPNASHYTRDSDWKVLIRVYAMGLGVTTQPGHNNNTDAGAFIMQYDLVNLAVFQGFGQGGGITPPGAGGDGG